MIENINYVMKKVQPRTNAYFVTESSNSLKTPDESLLFLQNVMFLINP